MSEKNNQSNTPSERTPLIQTVPVAPPRQRYPHQTARRVFSILISASCIIVLLLFLLPINFGNDDASSPWLFYPTSSWLETKGLVYKDLQKLLSDTPSPEKVSEWSRYYTAGPHLAGKNLSQAEWTRDRWQEFGVSDSSIVAYDVYINYPRDHRLALLNGSKVAFEASLEEDVLDEDPTTGLPNSVPTFHGYSASGNVTAQYVYANYGTYKDFEDLVNANVSLAGKIALVKYGRIFRGLKVKRAEELGMVGTIIYSDPGDDGGITEENGYKPYPEGPAREPSSVQRGSAQYLSVAPGDPTTPGYPSKPGVPRQSTNGSIPTIPSLPLSYKEAIPLLKALNGHGPSSSDFNKYWQGGGLLHKGVKYDIGPSPPEITLNLMNDQEYVTTPMWNVIGIINGTLADEVVVMGNHRDAWIAGGAADPNSGSAALNEVVRSFGKALAEGWKPLRTIVFASWDGEEYGLIGSTEWVEEYIPWLAEDVVAYLNVDVACSGPNFEASSAPLLDDIIYEATSLVASPNKTKGNTIRDTWNGHISTMGSGSDFTAFQDFAGIPSLDMGFSVGGSSALYHYHSNYDSYHWMETLGDPGWHYHVAAAQIWALAAARLVETPVVPFNATNYAVALSRYAASIKDKALKAGLTDKLGASVSFHRLDNAISHLLDAAVAIDKKAADVTQQLGDVDHLPWWRWREKFRLYIAVRKLNGRYKHLERHFLFAKGLDGRPWFKHTVFAPGIWTGYAGATFPGLDENVEAKNVTGLEYWQGVIAGQVLVATESLQM